MRSEDENSKLDDWQHGPFQRYAAVTMRQSQSLRVDSGGTKVAEVSIIVFGHREAMVRGDLVAVCVLSRGRLLLATTLGRLSTFELQPHIATRCGQLVVLYKARAHTIFCRSLDSFWPACYRYRYR